MKIIVNVDASVIERRFIYTIEDLNLTQKKWDLMSDDEKEKAIQDAIDLEPEQPDWILDSFKVEP